MNKTKTLISKLGILIFSFLLIACGSEESVNDSVSSKQQTNVDQKTEAKQEVAKTQTNVSSEQQIAKQEIIEAQASDSVSSNSNKQKIAGNGDAEFERGKKYYEEKNRFGRRKYPEEARYWFEKAAELGHGMAQYYLGWMYDLGQGGVEDEEKARYWWKKAIDWHEKTADLGDAKVQFRIGEMYRHSREYEKSKRRYWWEKAVFWYEKAAEQGHVEAQFRLAEAHSWGGWSTYSWWLEKEISEEEEFVKKKFYWMEKAAENGHKVAQRLLGLMYYVGNDAPIVPKDLKKACYWLEKVNRRVSLCDH